MVRRALFAIAIICVASMPARAEIAPAQDAVKALGPSTNLPIPRFVTLKKDEVYMRRGPGADHPIEWVYVRKHLPLEVVNEFELWREVKDADGTRGWVSANMLSGERYVMVTPRSGTKDHRWALRSKPDGKSNIVALADPGVIAELKHCPESWCEIAAGSRTGWIERTALWGVLPGEKVD